jgi:hypothetical protein
MSQCFRPIKEIWNSHSSCFVEPKARSHYSTTLRRQWASASDEHSYGDNSGSIILR